VAVLAGAAIAGDFTHGGTVPLAVWMGVALLVRRRWPVPVLALSIAALAGFGATDLGTPGWVWPATVAYVTVVLAGGFRWALGLGVINIAVVGIHLNVAVDTLDDDPDEAREALRLAQSAYLTWANWSTEQREPGSRSGSSGTWPGSGQLPGRAGRAHQRAEACR
jgi:hypothetical protein